MALLLLLVAGAGTIYAAAYLRRYGVYWAYSVCSSAGDLCNHTNWVVVIMLAAIALYVFRQERMS
jgi:hypothetical protein